MGGDCLKQLFQNLSTEQKSKLLKETSFTSVLDLISRIPKDIHLDVTSKLKLACEETGLHIFTSREFDDKLDHGDIDMFYVDGLIDIRNLIIQLFSPIVIKRNGTITTFSYKFSPTQYFQVDFIHVENEDLSNFFFSYGDIGMTMGMMASRHNLKYGDNGLFLKVSGKQMNEITDSDVFAEQEDHIFELSKSPEQISEFFELKYDVWLNGFQTMCEAYEWLSTSKFYVPSHFVEGEGKLKRHEKPKRKFLKGFEEFSQKMDTREKLSNEIVFDYAINFFGKLHEIEVVAEQIKQKRQIEIERASKFSGKMVVTKGIVGKNVGTFLAQFKSHIEDKFGCTFEHWLDLNTKEYVNEEFEMFCLLIGV